MKTKISVSGLFIFALFISPCFSQAPQGFNYQAIARDGSGNPITGQSLQVKLAVMADALGSTVYWEELFNPVTTNQFGLFSVIMGQGTRQTTSTVATFSSINWKVSPLFMRTQIYYQNAWKNMGTTQLWSVPYALSANNVTSSQSYLNISGNTQVMDSALFVVRNNKGQIVFAVYNEGVRIYVDDGISKGSTKGGFAIGGFGTAKGKSQDYLVVRPDTFRIYFDDTPGKGTKGGFAIGGFSTAKGPGAEYLGVKGTTPDIINPSQARILWYPLKEAFLTGRVIVVSPDSIGQNSFASGYESKAKGGWSQALGYKAVSKGDYSTSIGKNSLTLGQSSFAFGDHSVATGTGAYSFGTYASATGNQSIAIGSVGVDSAGNPTGGTTASGFGAFAAGFGSVASGQGAFTLGVGDTASVPFATAMGYETVSAGWFSTTMGLFSRVTGGVASLATGWGTLVEPNGWCGSAFGASTKSGNWAAAAFGDRTYASGHTSFATGYMSSASGHLSATFGEYTNALGDGAVAMGHFTNAQSYGSLVIGRYNVVSGTPGAWYSWEPAFAIGNGSSDLLRSNALTVFKDGHADFGAYINLNRTSSGSAIYVNNNQALWADAAATHFSWGYGLSYNFFARPVTIAGSDVSPSYTLNVNGSIGANSYYNNSDIRWKTNLVQIDNVMNILEQVNSYRFNWNEAATGMNFEKGVQIGFVAQEVEKYFPELVRTDSKGYKAVSYDKFSVLLLEGMKEQQRQIDKQKEENLELRSQLNELKEEVEQLKGLIGNK